jgi:hypothetical protein
MGVLLAWLTEIGIITWRDLSGKAPDHTISGFPLPADYLATFMVFGVLGLVPKDNAGASRAATLAAWAFVIATYMNALPTQLNPSGTPKATGTASTTTPPTATSSTTVTPGG